MQIEIVLDPVCPWCLIGKRRLAAALKRRPEIRATLRWRPFQLNPWIPAEGLPREAYLLRKFRHRNALHAYRRALQAARNEGVIIDLHKIQRQPNTFDAHRLIAFAGRQGLQGAMVDKLFEAFFTDGQDIGAHEVLVDLAAQVGLERREAGRMLSGNDLRQTIHDEETAVRRIGLQGVPCFILDGRYAISGAQEPEYFLPMFDLAVGDRIQAFLHRGDARLRA